MLSSIGSLLLEFGGLRQKPGIIALGLRHKLGLKAFVLLHKLGAKALGKLHKLGVVSLCAGFESGVLVGGHPNVEDGLQYHEDDESDDLNAMSHFDLVVG
jgi:hypothetical protein